VSGRVVDGTKTAYQRKREERRGSGKVRESKGNKNTSGVRNRLIDYELNRNHSKAEMKTLVGRNPRRNSFH